MDIFDTTLTELVNGHEVARGLSRGFPMEHGSAFALRLDGEMPFVPAAQWVWIPGLEEDSTDSDNTPGQVFTEPRSTLSPINRLAAIVRSGLCRATPLAAKVGLIRLAMSASGPDRRVPSGFTPSEAIVLHGLESQPKAIVASSGCGAWEKSAAEAREAGSLGDVPLVVLTAGKPLTTGDPTEDRELRAFHEIWVHQLQPKLAALSTRGRQIVVEESSHGIVGDMPSAAVEAIRQIISETRGI
jgi:hypothetical protein